jgi:hypothetical protein
MAGDRILWDGLGGGNDADEWLLDGKRASRLNATFGTMPASATPEEHNQDLPGVP